MITSEEEKKQKHHLKVGNRRRRLHEFASTHELDLWKHIYA